jgi:hypothetical protein
MENTKDKLNAMTWIQDRLKDGATEKERIFKQIKVSVGDIRGSVKIFDDAVPQIKNIRKIKPSEEAKCQEYKKSLGLKLKEKDNEFVSPDGVPTIYAIFAENKFADQERLKAIKEKFARLKTNHKKDGKNYAVSKINEDYWEISKLCLYIGSSANIFSRLKNHLGIGGKSRGSSSLYLSDWWWDPENKIKIYLWDFGDYLSKHREISLHDIEDLLWASCHPLFGKEGKGPNSK